MVSISIAIDISILIRMTNVSAHHNIGSNPICYEPRDKEMGKPRTLNIGLAKRKVFETPPACNRSITRILVSHLTFGSTTKDIGHFSELFWLPF